MHPLIRAWKPYPPNTCATNCSRLVHSEYLQRLFCRATADCFSSFRMLNSVALTSAHLTLNPDGTLPREVPVRLNSKAVEPATHLFAIPSSSSQSRKTFTLYPIHASIITSHCSRLPALPPSTASSSSLPVLPLGIPHASSFPMLQAYLYTKRTDILLSSLLTSKSRLATVTGLWRNTCVLGVADEGLWNVLDIAWASVVGSTST